DRPPPAQQGRPAAHRCRFLGRQTRREQDDAHRTRSGRHRREEGRCPMSSVTTLADRIHTARTVANQTGAFPPPPPAGHQTITEIAAEANGVTLQTPARHSDLNVYISGMKTGSLTDRAIKVNETKTKKP